MLFAAKTRGSHSPLRSSSQLAFFLDVVFEGQDVRVTRLDHADSLNDGAIRVTQEARRRGVSCLEYPVYRTINEVVREAAAIQRRKRPRPGVPGLPALALVGGIEPRRIHGRADGLKNPRASGSRDYTGEGDNASWDECDRSYAIVLVEAVPSLRR